MYFIILIMIILNIIYNTSGFLLVITFIVWTIVLLFATFILITNPQNYLIRVIQIISLVQLFQILFIALKIIIFNIFI
jgi:hypothetical protein